jgi:hypothetical protein
MYFGRLFFYFLVIIGFEQFITIFCGIAIQNKLSFLTLKANFKALAL